MLGTRKRGFFTKLKCVVNNVSTYSMCLSCFGFPWPVEEKEKPKVMTGSKIEKMHHWISYFQKKKESVAILYHWDGVRHSRMLCWWQKLILARRFGALRHHQLANRNGNKLDSYWYRRTRWGVGVKGGDVISAKMLHVTRLKIGLPGHMVEVPEVITTHQHFDAVFHAWQNLLKGFKLV